MSEKDKDVSEVIRWFREERQKSLAQHQATDPPSVEDRILEALTTITDEKGQLKASDEKHHSGGSEQHSLAMETEEEVTISSPPTSSLSSASSSSSSYQSQRGHSRPRSRSAEKNNLVYNTHNNNNTKEKETKKEKKSKNMQISVSLAQPDEFQTFDPASSKSLSLPARSPSEELLLPNNKKVTPRTLARNALMKLARRKTTNKRGTSGDYPAVTTASEKDKGKGKEREKQRKRGKSASGNLSKSKEDTLGSSLSSSEDEEDGNDEDDEDDDDDESEDDDEEEAKREASSIFYLEPTKDVKRIIHATSFLGGVSDTSRAGMLFSDSTRPTGPMSAGFVPVSSGNESPLALSEPSSWSPDPSLGAPLVKSATAVGGGGEAEGGDDRQEGSDIVSPSSEIEQKNGEEVGVDNEDSKQRKVELLQQKIDELARLTEEVSKLEASLLQEKKLLRKLEKKHKFIL